MSRKVIVSCAITGSIHIPTQSPYLPITPEEIAQQAIDAAKAGASSVHIHARDPETGRPTADLNIYRKIVERVKSESDAVICITTGGGLGMTIEQRAGVVPEFKPELASLTPGSVNFALFPLTAKYKDWKYDWEKPYIEATRDSVFHNSFAEIEKICRIMNENGTKPELEIFDVGQINNVAFIINAGLLKKPVFVQFVMGILGGIPATIENLLFLKETADRLIGPGDYEFSALAPGRMEFPIVTTSALLGGHCRVGLEDNLYLERGVLAKSNAELVGKMIRILKEFSFEPATPDEARQILGLTRSD